LRRAFFLATIAVCPLAALLLAGCNGAGRAATYVGSWEGSDDTLVVHRNGLAEGRLFGATASRSFTWRADGPTMRLTFGRIASDTVEYRGMIDEAGRLVVESESGNCVLERANVGTP
jgi:outer membrane biogenesis lipoprotein LolB